MWLLSNFERHLLETQNFFITHPGLNISIDNLIYRLGFSKYTTKKSALRTAKIL